MPGFGQENLPPCTSKQGGTSKVLQLADLLRQRWLGHVEPLGGPAEVQLLGDGAKVAQVSQFHGVSLER